MATIILRPHQGYRDAKLEGVDIRFIRQAYWNEQGPVPYLWFVSPFEAMDLERTFPARYSLRFVGLHDNGFLYALMPEWWRGKKGDLLRAMPGETQMRMHPMRIFLDDLAGDEPIWCIKDYNIYGTIRIEYRYWKGHSVRELSGSFVDQDIWTPNGKGFFAGRRQASTALHYRHLMEARHAPVTRADFGRFRVALGLSRGEPQPRDWTKVAQAHTPTQTGRHLSFPGAEMDVFAREDFALYDGQGVALLQFGLTPDRRSIVKWDPIQGNKTIAKYMFKRPEIRHGVGWMVPWDRVMVHRTRDLWRFLFALKMTIPTRGWGFRTGLDYVNLLYLIPTVVPHDECLKHGKRFPHLPMDLEQAVWAVLGMSFALTHALNSLQGSLRKVRGDLDLYERTDVTRGHYVASLGRYEDDGWNGGPWTVRMERGNRIKPIGQVIETTFLDVSRSLLKARPKDQPLQRVARPRIKRALDL